MSKLLIGLLAVVSIGVQAKEVGQYTNNNGGLTILTDASCPIDDHYLYGLATGDKVATQTFCWLVSGDDVVLYLPLGNSVKVPIKQFEKPNGKQPKTYNAL